MLLYQYEENGMEEMSFKNFCVSLNFSNKNKEYFSFLIFSLVFNSVFFHLCKYVIFHLRRDVILKEVMTELEEAGWSKTPDKPKDELTNKVFLKVTNSVVLFC